MSSKDNQSSSSAGGAPSCVPEISSSSTAATTNGQGSRQAEDLAPSASNGQARAEKVDVHPEAYSRVRNTLENLTSSMHEVNTEMVHMRGVASSLEEALAAYDDEVKGMDQMASSLEQFVTRSKQRLGKMNECAEAATTEIMEIRTQEKAKHGKRQTDPEVTGTPAKQRKESENVPAERLEEGETLEAAVEHRTTLPGFDEAPIVKDESNQKQSEPQKHADLGEQKNIDPKPVVEEQLAVPPVTASLVEKPKSGKTHPVVENQVEKLGDEKQTHPKPVIEDTSVEAPVAASLPTTKTSGKEKKVQGQRKVNKGKEARRKAQAERQEAEELAERQLIAEKVALEESIRQYVDQQFPRKPIYRGNLNKSKQLEFMSSRYKHYKQVGDTKMSLLYMLLNENKSECVLQDMLFMSEKRQYLDDLEMFNYLEKRYYQRVTGHIHPDVQILEQSLDSDDDELFGLNELNEDMEALHTSMAGNTPISKIKESNALYIKNQILLRQKPLETIDKTMYDEIELLLLEKHHEFKDEVANWTYEQSKAVFAERSAHYSQSDAEDKDYCSAVFKLLSQMSVDVLKLDAFFIDGVLNKRFEYDLFEKKYIFCISASKERKMESKKQ